MKLDLIKIAQEHLISVDEVRERWLSLRVAYWKSDFPRFAREVIRIRTKEGDLAPLELNSAQVLLHSAVEIFQDDLVDGMQFHRSNSTGFGIQ